EEPEVAEDDLEGGRVGPDEAPLVLASATVADHAPLPAGAGARRRLLHRAALLRGRRAWRAPALTELLGVARRPRPGLDLRLAHGGDTRGLPAGRRRGHADGGAPQRREREGRVVRPRPGRADEDALARRVDPVREHDGDRPRVRVDPEARPG